MDNPQASTSLTAAGLDKLAEIVQARVRKRVQQLPLLGPYSTDTSSDEEEELPVTMCGRKPLKSGRFCTKGTQVLHKVDRAHEFIYSADGKAANYYALSVHLFVSGYVKITDS